MNDNPTEPNQGGGNELGQLFTDAERFATRTLLEEAGEIETPQQTGTIDSIFQSLCHPGRRYILTYLLRAEGYVTMTELVDYVMEKTTANKQGDLRNRIAVKLTHNHLPRLVDEGFVEYNMERQMITPTENIKLVEPYLKVAIVHQKQFSSDSPEK